MTTRQPTTSPARRRERWADNLRVALIAGVVVAHTATAYVVDIPWYYDDEKSSAGVWGIVVGFPTFTAGAFGLGPLFVVAGWFAAASLARQGPGAFAAARLRRLGLPLIARRCSRSASTPASTAGSTGCPGPRSAVSVRRRQEASPPSAPCSAPSWRGAT